MGFPVAGPHIISLNPSSGPIGTHVNIFGSNFEPTPGTPDPPEVLFNGHSATVLSYTSSNIIAVVPAGATTGFVEVAVNEQLSNGVTFTVSGGSAPTLISLTPSNGPAGQSVVIAGTNFGATQSTSTVKFNGIVAAVTSWAASSITATVPPTATTGPVVVTTSAGVSNSLTFTVTTPSNGGTSGPLNLFLIPAQNFSGTPVIWTFDTTDFNDTVSGSFYSWKVEDVAAGRTPTIERVIISYRDLGQATITLTLSGTNDQQEVVSESQSVPIGTVAASGKIVTQLVGLALTAQNLQLTVTRAANGGPVSITKVRMEGRVEMTVY